MYSHLNIGDTRQMPLGVDDNYLIMPVDLCLPVEAGTRFNLVKFVEQPQRYGYCDTPLTCLALYADNVLIRTWENYEPDMGELRVEVLTYLNEAK